MNNTKQPLVTACLRSFGRPLRTKRMLECISAQTFINFELLFMGDGCQQFAELIKTEWFKRWTENFKLKGNRVYYFNQPNSSKDWGAKVTNIAIKIATGQYFVFLDNDDKILPEHIQFYYRSITGFERSPDTKADFVYNPTLVYNGGNTWIMEPQLKEGSVGHGSLIVNTEFLKKMPPHEAVYGQDWKLIENMARMGQGQKGAIAFPTYHVMSLPGKTEPGMENDI